MLAALFETSCSVATSITAVHSGSRKDHILSKFATAAIDTQNTTKYRQFRLKLSFKEKTQVDSDAKIYFPKLLNLTLAIFNLTAVPDTQHTADNRNLHKLSEDR